MAIATLRALGHEAVIAVDVQERNLELARQLGATTTISAAQDDLGAALVSGAGGPVAAIVDFVNNSSTAPAAFAALRKGGTMVQVGLFGGELVVPTALLTLKIITIQGSFVGSLGELEELVELARRGALPHIPIIDGQFTASSVQESLDRLAAGGVPGRIVLSA
jgi:alcohol dehydrogenase/propanol-preferring alcohol dehydrogenase